MNEQSKIEVETVDAVEAPPKARVEVDDHGTPVDAATDAGPERKPDYLTGFLAQKPEPVLGDDRA